MSINKKRGVGGELVLKVRDLVVGWGGGEFLRRVLMCRDSIGGRIFKGCWITSYLRYFLLWQSLYIRCGKPAHDRHGTTTDSWNNNCQNNCKFLRHPVCTHPLTHGEKSTTLSTVWWPLFLLSPDPPTQYLPQNSVLSPTLSHENGFHVFSLWFSVFMVLTLSHENLWKTMRHQHHLPLSVWWKTKNLVCFNLVRNT